ncbi:SMK killer toxin resistance protein [Extremus antarcticus]|uniref:SMK killer toxin resistance protein n=1 Tax=Extremus antarcticus TaxID=702011 RepID=A0AAJ0GDX8_9PEZI|nr:SMK killer toxin resistance protein [Extremus antarcticus]
MADFLSNLWGSVFTPGPTPTLLLATNLTFGALQILLLALLVATYSVHFAILSFLCGGLWWSINWFATELHAAQVKEEEAEKLRKRRPKGEEWREKGEVEDSADDEGEVTEVEEEAGVREEYGEVMRPEVQERLDESRAAASGAEQASAGARQRAVEDSDRSGDVSGDSEWERVSQEDDR